MSEREPIYKQVIETNNDSAGMVKNKALAEEMAYTEKDVLETPLPEKPRPIDRIDRGAMGEALSIISGIFMGKDRAAARYYWEEVERFRREKADYEERVLEIEDGKEDRAHEAAEKLLKHEIFERAYDTYLRELHRETELNPTTAKHQAKEAAKKEVEDYITYRDQLSASKETTEKNQ